MIEALTNIAVGLGLSIILNYIVLTYYGFEVNIHQMTWLAAVMTIASFIRSYWLRRIFNLWDTHYDDRRDQRAEDHISPRDAA